MHPEHLARLLEEQAGVVSRRQVLACGLDDSFIERRLRRQDWTRVHRGVYVNHTGQPTWSQYAWAAVLFAWPAALCQESALAAAGLRDAVRASDRPGSGRAGRDSRPTIHVAVDQKRRVEPPDGVRLHRVTGLASCVHPSGSPPRVRVEHALLEVASTASSDAAAVAVLADACQTGRTTCERLLGYAHRRPSLPRRRFLLQVLDDVATGCYSVLERRYLTRVERPHGLPTATRQRRVRPGRSAAYRDVEYAGLATVVELDGRLGHEWQQDRWGELGRDIAGVVAGDVTLRLGWRQVLDPCRTALTVARLLRARGWRGTLSPCGPRCPVRKEEG